MAFNLDELVAGLSDEETRKLAELVLGALTNEEVVDLLDETLTPSQREEVVARFTAEDDEGEDDSSEEEDEDDEDYDSK